MLKLKAHKPNNLWFNLLLFVISFTFLIVWLPLIRSICDGTSYQWGTTIYGFAISGAGLTWSLLFIFIQFVFYLFLFLSFYWMKNRMVHKILVIIWYLFVFGNLFFDIAVNGDTMFHGDTLNVHVSLLSLVLPLGLFALGLIAFVFRKDLSLESPDIGWNRKNNRWFIILYGLLPIQIMLLAFGEPHGTTDQIGVVICILQALLVPLIVRPYKMS